MKKYAPCARDLFRGERNGLKSGILLSIVRRAVIQNEIAKCLSLNMSKNPKDCPPDDLIPMALSDKVSFEEIYKKCGLSEKEVKVIMKTHLKLSSYVNWRKRVRKRQYKHRKKFALSQLNRRQLGFDLD